MALAIRTATRLEDQDDVNVTPAPGVDGYALVWDNATSRFVLAARGTVFGSGTAGQVAYWSAADTLTGAATFTYQTGASPNLFAQAANAAHVPVVIRAAAGQTANLQEWQSSAGAVSTLVTSAGWVGIALAAGDTVDQPVSITGNVLHRNGTWSMRRNGGFLLSSLNLAGAAYDNIAMRGSTYYLQTATTTRVFISSTAVGINTETPSARLHVFGGADAVQFLVTGHTTQAVATPMAQITRNDTAAGVSAMLGLTALGSGANGDGGALYLRGKSSTTAGVDFARISWLANDNTHATRKYDLVFSAFDTAEREGIRIRGNGSEPALGFYGVEPVARQLLATGAGASVDDVITALQNLGLLKQA